MLGGPLYFLVCSPICTVTMQSYAIIKSNCQIIHVAKILETLYLGPTSEKQQKKYFKQKLKCIQEKVV